MGITLVLNVSRLLCDSLESKNCFLSKVLLCSESIKTIKYYECFRTEM